MVTRRINRGLGRVTEVLGQIAKDALSRRLPDSGKDEFSALAKVVSEMANEQRRLVGMILVQSGEWMAQGERLGTSAMAIVTV